MQLNLFIHLILTTTLGDGHYYYPHFADEETKA